MPSDVEIERMRQGLRLIQSGHYHALGHDWLQKTAGAAADQIDRLTSSTERTLRADYTRHPHCTTTNPVSHE